jgi:hypothetical protein
MSLRSISPTVSQSMLLQQRQRLGLETAEQLAQAPRATAPLSRTAEQTIRRPLVNASDGWIGSARPSGPGEPRALLRDPLFPTPGIVPSKDDPKAGKPVDPLPPDPVENYSEAEAARDAAELHEAVDGLGTDEAAVYETLEGKSPAQIELIRQQYQETYGEDLDAVLRDDFSGDELTLVNELLVGAPYLLERNKQIAEQTETGAAVIAAAEERGVPVHVLSDEEYAERYPDTSGVYVDGQGVYVPASSLNGESDNVLVHELVHALLGETLDTDRPQEERVADVRELFEELGLDPDQGEAIAEATEGWPAEFNVTAEHVTTYLVTRATERERQGLPPESPEQLQAVIERAVTRELALELQRLDMDPDYSDEELLALWAATPQGRALPPAGDTVEEQAENLRRTLERVSTVEYVEGPPPSLPGGATKGSPKGPAEDFDKIVRDNLRSHIHA